MVKIRFTLISFFVWLIVAVCSLKMGLIWELLKPKLSADRSHILEFGLFKSYNQEKSNFILVVGDNNFVDRVHKSSDHKNENIIYLSFPLDNLCLFGQAIFEYSKRKNIESYWVQASPQFWSNRANNLLAQNIDTWNEFEKPISLKSIKSTINIFFNALSTILNPELIDNIKESNIKFEELSFVEKSAEMKCFLRNLKKANISSDKIHFVRHNTKIKKSVNPKLYDEFESYFKPEGKRFKDALFIKDPPF